jgi:hypothetical protein
MVSLNFIRSEYDHCVSFKKLENDILIILVLYVDGMLVARKNMVEINRLKGQLVRAFNMKDIEVENKSYTWRYTETRKMVSYGYHNKSMWRKYL